MNLGPIADEGGSPEVDQVPVLLRLDKTAEVWIPLPYGSCLRYKKNQAQDLLSRKVQVKSQSIIYNIC